MDNPRKRLNQEKSNVQKEAKKNYLPMQAGDVPATWADVDDLVEDLSYKPTIKVEEGIETFVEWYKAYYLSHKE